MKPVRIGSIGLGAIVVLGILRLAFPTRISTAEPGAPRPPQPGVQDSTRSAPEEARRPSGGAELSAGERADPSIHPARAEAATAGGDGGVAGRREPSLTADLASPAAGRSELLAGETAATAEALERQSRAFAAKYEGVSAARRKVARDDLEKTLAGNEGGPAPGAELKREIEWLEAHPSP